MGNCFSEYIFSPSCISLDEPFIPAYDDTNSTEAQELIAAVEAEVLVRNLVLNDDEVLV